MNGLDESYRHCASLAQQSRSSFLLSFLLLPQRKRRSMYALYAFLRATDDISDSPLAPAMRRQQLETWHDALEEALTFGSTDPAATDHLLWPALVDTVDRYSIPHEYLFEAVRGAMMDQTRNRYEHFEDLELYCYRAASVVGLACLHIWGFSSERAIEPAANLGVAFQLTNILRDAGDDARNDRVYLPLSELRRFGCSVDDLRSGATHDRVAMLVAYQVDRALGMYRSLDDLLPYLSPEGQRMCRVMTATYRALLDRIARVGPRVLQEPIRLPRWQKLFYAARGWFARAVPPAPKERRGAAGASGTVTP